MPGCETASAQTAAPYPTKPIRIVVPYAPFALDPLYEEPGRSDDELLKFENVILTPHTAAQPRFNALNDIEELIAGLARALAP